jgi:benzoyl-CoA-dihydrodiol lyase
VIDFERDPAAYRHWKVDIEPPVATVTMLVDAAGGLGDYDLKLNSYDLAVDIELYDITQRLRFEHPEVKAVVLTGGLDKVFSAGANIQMLAGASHHDKVNFCKFTNETRLAIEDATQNSGQVWIAALNGTAAGGGYELALACDEIVLIDDRSSTVSLPEVPLLGVLPGTGGLTRLVDKRRVRRDRADVFATRAEGVRGAQAIEWGLVDSIAPRSAFDAHVRSRALARAAESDRPGGTGAVLEALDSHVSVERDSKLGCATLTVHGGPSLQVARELEDTILRLRFNEPELGTWVLKTRGTLDDEATDDWLAREIRLYWKRVLKRLDVSARTLVALIDKGSCFTGTLAELALAADRTYMLDQDGVTLCLTAANFGWYPMGNGLTRLETRFYGRDFSAVRSRIDQPVDAPTALDLGLVTATPDDIDWHDELRLMLEERASFSPDALTGLEANIRFAGPETLETKIFGRLTAWQNWIFQRPNASGPEGALRRYGTGSRPEYDRRRV